MVRDQIFFCIVVLECFMCISHYLTIYSIIYLQKLFFKQHRFAENTKNYHFQSRMSDINKSDVGFFKSDVGWHLQVSIIISGKGTFCWLGKCLGGMEKKYSHWLFIFSIVRILLWLFDCTHLGKLGIPCVEVMCNLLKTVVFCNEKWFCFCQVFSRNGKKNNIDINCLFLVEREKCWRTWNVLGLAD